MGRESHGSVSLFPGSWQRRKKPLADSETVKDRMLAIVDEVLNDDKIKTGVIRFYKCPRLTFQLLAGLKFQLRMFSGLESTDG